MTIPRSDASQVTTQRRVLGQVIFCKGCCCGRTDRGLPAVPVERIKRVWKTEDLNRVIQLTMSGCVGPCDVPNVAVVVTAAGTRWFGRLETDSHYDLLVDWARACRAAGLVLPLPEALEPHGFDPFVDAVEFDTRRRR